MTPEPQVRIATLHVYPVKSCRGSPVRTMDFDRYGPIGDRRWMVVDGDGVFLSQRELPRMALIAPTLSDRNLRLAAPGMAALELPVAPRGPELRVQVWSDRVSAVACGDEAADWLSTFLGVAAQLVHTGPDFRRRVDGRYAPAGTQTAFSDGFPFLVTSAAALDELNRRLSVPVTMERFRPNIVLQGCPAHAEDGWQSMEVNGSRFRLVKACARCAIITNDPLRGRRDGGEPLRTLAAYRRGAGGRIYFGQNAYAEQSSGRLSVGQPVLFQSREGL